MSGEVVELLAGPQAEAARISAATQPANRMGKTEIVTDAGPFWPSEAASADPRTADLVVT